MMGQRRFAPNLYYQLSLDRLIPADHLLRCIASAIDLSFVYPMARPYYSHTGQPSVDPVVLFKALLSRPTDLDDHLAPSSGTVLLRPTGTFSRRP